jgi:hypothetical protein
MRNGCRDYHMTRRSMLGATGASLLGMHVGSLLARADVAQAARAEHVILFWCGGGMSHIDTWDPKPGRPTQGEFNPIKTSADGVQISEIFPNLAKQMHHASLIRSIAGVNGDHGRATYQLQTSYNESSNLRHPGIGSVVVHERDRVGDLPSYISISGQAPRASYLGQKCEAYYVGAPGERDPYLAFPEGITKVRGDKRLEILARFNQRQAGQVGAIDVKANEQAVNDAVALMRSPALKAFELDNEKPETIARYGDTEFGRGALLARRLVETGVRFVQVNRGGFDTHSNNFPAMTAHGAVMDPALASLVADLHASGKLSKTMVIVLSEFGRTPRVNNNAGRDHWARVFSCFIAGGGVKGGHVVGSSDIDGMEPKDRPVRVPDLHASVCFALGINPHKEVMTPLERPMKLVDDGQPVRELFA